jgi:glycosyltransferase involved in cell wall biosynthesis
MPTPPAIASVRERLGIRPPAGRLVTTVGNIRKVKGLDVLIRAAAHVCARIPDVKFVVVGGISERAYYNELLQMIENLGLGDKFKFLGHQSDVFPLLCASDVFVLPSRSEGFSNALLEGMAAGVPCVTTRVGGNAEAVQDGETGFLVEAEDATAMADRIWRLIEDPRQAQQMGHAGRKRVSDDFSLQSMMVKLEATYENLLRN